MPRILLTNDDGIGAPGLNALEAAFSSAGEVYVAAPATEQSATSRAITIRHPLRFHDCGPRRWAVEGTPADTVMMAVNRILAFRPDIVVSGINYGPNLGENIFYSGTVAAAAEAAKYGIPAVAVSVDARSGVDFAGPAEFAVKLVLRILHDGLPPGVALNVNIPYPDQRGVAITRQSQKISRNLMVESTDPRGRPYYWMHEEIPLADAEPGSDYAAVRDGMISVTPLRFDPTALDLIAPLEVLGKL
jgi:5'-nucleotidase